MKILEPARRGWTDVLECVDEVFRTREGGRGWSLHGGTLLAMRWDGGGTPSGGTQMGGRVRQEDMVRSKLLGAPASVEFALRRLP